MRRMIFASLFLVGCGDIIGLNGYTDQDGGGTGPDGNMMMVDSGGGKDTSPNDTGMQAEACNGNPENCTNGVDDDCNGQTDCADMACKTGFVCVPAVPMGWTVASYDQDQRPACANGYGNSLDVSEGLNAAAATCGCGCTTTQPSCTTGNLTILAGSNGMACNNQANQTDPASTSCTATNPNFATNNAGIAVTGPAPSGGSCAANGTKMVPGVTFSHNGRTCDYAGMTGGGCMNGNVCAPDPKPFASCIAQKGMQACPTGWPVQHLVGSMVTDTRDCTACTCQFNAGTCGGTTTFYSDGACQNNATNIAVDGACHAVTNRTYRGYKYAPTTNASCTGSNSAPSGMAVFGDLQTVCCAN